MKIVALVFLVFLMPAPAQADEIEVLCMNAFNQKPAVGVEYVPDVDVYGNPVVPADLYGRQKLTPDVVLIPLTIDLAQRLGDLPEGTELKSQIGMLEVYQDGKVFLNGQNLSQQALALCEGRSLEDRPVLEVREDAPAPAPLESPPAVATGTEEEGVISGESE